MSVESIQATVEAVGSVDKRAAVFGPAYGHRSHYGHFDLLVLIPGEAKDDRVGARREAGDTVVAVEVGIARVQGDQIILTGTTIEEVKEVHRETLILTVEHVNKEVETHVRLRRQQEQADEQVRPCRQPPQRSSHPHAGQSAPHRRRHPSTAGQRPNRDGHTSRTSCNQEAS